MYDIFISYSTKDQEIAEEICECLTNEGFQCFLSSESLHGILWSEEILSALEEARGYVIIVSQNSAESNEVFKEVTLATRHSRYIFPFIIDDIQMEKRMEYHLAPFQWIRAVIPPREQRKRDLVHRVKDALEGRLTDGNVNYGRTELIGQQLSPRTDFLGRDEELQEIEDAFSEGHRVVFLSGMGGMGKSELARAYAKKQSKRYEKIVMFSYQADLLNTITSDSAINIKGCMRGSVNSGQMETTEEYYERKMDALRRIVNDNTLLILDNFDVEEDERLEDFLALKCHKLITTRASFAELGHPELQIKPMDRETVLLPLMEKLDHRYIKEDERDYAQRIITLLDGHTYAVSLTASQMKVGRIKPVKMYEMLTEEGLKYKTSGRFARKDDNKKMTAPDYIRNLFDFSHLTEEERTILYFMACTPWEGVDIDLFMELADVDDFEILRHLIALNWIQEDVGADTIRIHMLVRELAKEQEDFSIDSCAPYFRKLHERLGEGGGWNCGYRENLAVESSVMALLRTFPEPPLVYRDEFDNFTTFAWIMNYFAESEKMAMWLYDSCVKEYGPLSDQAGYQATRVAAVFHNQGDDEHARPWYFKAKEIMMQTETITSNKITCYLKVARCDLLAGKYELAEEEYQEVLAMAQFLMESNSTVRIIPSIDITESTRARMEICFIKSNLALIDGVRGNYEKAKEILREQIKESIATYQTNAVGYLKLALADLHLACKETNEAERIYYEMMEFWKENLGVNLRVPQIYEKLGDTKIVKGCPLEAVSHYADALNYLDTNFPGDRERKQILEEKYARARRGEVFEVKFQVSEL